MKTLPFRNYCCGRSQSRALFHVSGHGCVDIYYRVVHVRTCWARRSTWLSARHLSVVYCSGSQFPWTRPWDDRTSTSAACCQRWSPEITPKSRLDYLLTFQYFDLMVYSAISFWAWWNAPYPCILVECFCSFFDQVVGALLWAVDSVSELCAVLGCTCDAKNYTGISINTKFRKRLAKIVSFKTQGNVADA